MATVTAQLLQKHVERQATEAETREAISVAHQPPNPPTLTPNSNRTLTLTTHP